MDALIKIHPRIAHGIAISTKPTIKIIVDLSFFFVLCFFAGAAAGFFFTVFFCSDKVLHSLSFTILQEKKGFDQSFPEPCVFCKKKDTESVSNAWMSPFNQILFFNSSTISLLVIAGLAWPLDFFMT